MSQGVCVCVCVNEIAAAARARREYTVVLFLLLGRMWTTDP